MCTVVGVCEPVSSFSHLAAGVLAFFAAVPLVRASSRNLGHRVALVVYATAVIALLIISGTYHSLVAGRLRAIMQHADHLAIWILIAGTFTAIHGIMCRGFWRRWVLVFVWTYAAVAIVLESIWFEELSGAPCLAMYLVFGWVGVATIIKVGRQIGFWAIAPVWAGGVVFSAGAVLEALGLPVISRRWLGPHELFHFAVIAGVAIHWLFIRRLAQVHAPRLRFDNWPVVAPLSAAHGK
jgi:channel protein (hemolysin III family)